MHAVTTCRGGIKLLSAAQKNVQRGMRNIASKLAPLLTYSEKCEVKIHTMGDSKTYYLAGNEGFEPPITGPEPVALPLGQFPIN